MTRRFILNEVSYFGPGARKELPGEVRRLGLHKALVCTDKDLIKFGVAQKVLDVLDEAQIPYEVFSEIKQNPTVKNVKLGLEAFAKSGADFLLAIGGGSSIDTSKAIGIITNNPEFADVVSLEGVADTKHKSVPIIALPTTAPPNPKSFISSRLSSLIPPSAITFESMILAFCASRSSSAV
jgi:lactaldehyde reductase